MRFADGLKILLFASTFAVMGCDDEEDDTGGSGGSGGDRASTILGLSGDATNGGTVFSANACATEACHGADGLSGMSTPDLMTSVGAASDDHLVMSLLEGKGTMPSQAALSDQDLADVLAWLNMNFGG